MKLVTCVLSIFAVLSSGLSQTRVAQHDVASRIECSTCHTCAVPTKADPCLRDCPRASMVTVHNSPEEGPGILRIDKLSAFSDLYEPVTFSHRAHATMSELSGSCTLCHHYNPPGSVLACETCHQREPSAAGSDLSKPGLKGAYHRQCISCHREWTAVNTCTDCHALKGTSPTTPSGAQQPLDHRRVARPTRVVYETEAADGKVVTFYHDEHVDLYGLSCVSCHQNQQCSDCHAKETPDANKVATDRDPHDACSTCHTVDDGCALCHTKVVRARFDHESRSGFALARYHASLSCERCHTTSGTFAGLKKDCRSCHPQWDPESFRHRVTGLELDELHGGLSCEDCHLDGNFGVRPTCSGCHEEKSYPKDKPGRVL